MALSLHKNKVIPVRQLPLRTLCRSFLLLVWLQPFPRLSGRMSRLASSLVLAFSSFGLVGASSENLLAVEIRTSDSRTIETSIGTLPVIFLDLQPPATSTSTKEVGSGILESIPNEAISTGQSGGLFYIANTNGASGNNRISRYFSIYDPVDDILYVRDADLSGTSTGTRILGILLKSQAFEDAKNYFKSNDDQVDFIPLIQPVSIIGPITQHTGKMIAVGLLLGIGLLSFKVGITFLDKFLDNKFWHIRFENERSALEKEYNRLSRVYRNDPEGQKNLDRRFARRNTRLYEKYADYGVEKEDLIRTE